VIQRFGENLMTDNKSAVELAEAYREDIVSFLREMIAIPAESCQEEERCARVKSEYEKLGFDEVWFDSLGSVIARIGNGPIKILMDGHIDCVGISDPKAWDYDPFEGKRENGKIYGRGAVDELPAIACMAYGAKILKEIGMPEEVSVYLCSSVMEEDCDGHALLSLIEKDGLRPDFVILGEPTDMQLFRGHRGRMEMTITTHGVSAHGAHCDRGVNAIYKAAPIIQEIEELHKNLKDDDFLGKGSITVSYIDCKSPSLCAVPDQAKIYLDRRLTKGETVDSAMAEVRSLPSIGDAVVELPDYNTKSWKGTIAHQEKYFPTWVLEEDHQLVQGSVEAIESITGIRPQISRWTFSTNGVASMGRLGIPTIGFAPGLEELAHSTNEWVKEDDLVTATAVYSRIPQVLATIKDRMDKEI
jgi:putative selenium metabolism hydrolase